MFHHFLTLAVKTGSLSTSVPFDLHACDMNEDSSDAYAGRSIDIDKELRIIKPSLIEAKQCQKYFDARAVGVKVQVITNVHTSSQDINTSANVSRNKLKEESLGNHEEFGRLTNDYTYLKQQASYRLNTESPESREVDQLINKHSDSLKMSVNVRLVITNLYDTLPGAGGDIQSELSFQALLLCDGLIVSPASEVTLLSSEYIHRDNNTTYLYHTFPADRYSPGNCGSSPMRSGRHQSMQEVECAASIPIVVQSIDSLREYLKSGSLNSVNDNQQLEVKGINNSSFTEQPELNESFLRSKYVGTQPVSHALCNHDATALIGVPWSLDLLHDRDGINELNRVIGIVHGNVNDNQRAKNMQAMDILRSQSYCYWTTIQFDNSPTAPSSQKQCSETAARYTQAKSMYLSTDMKSSSNDANLELNNSEQWSIVLIARLARDTAWAGRGYPTGFVQLNITHQAQNALKHCLCKYPSYSNQLTANAYREPSSSVSSCLQVDTEFIRVESVQSEDNCIREATSVTENSDIAKHGNIDSLKNQEVGVRVSWANPKYVEVGSNARYSNICLQTG